MSSSIKERIFLVGCPRSGTTLLQSLLASHPDVISFPESHFFRILLSNRWIWRRIFNLASPIARTHFAKFLEETGHPEAKRFLSWTALTVPQYGMAFNKALDAIAQQEGKIVWLEKTPGHVRYIDCVEATITQPKFIHIVRNGVDVVASLYEVTHQYPDVWKKPYSIEECIARWEKDVKRTYDHLHKLNHVLVRYEKLVEYPKLILTDLCRFIGTTFHEEMLQNYKQTARMVTLSNEPWKAGVSEEIRRSNSNKFNKLFDETQRRYIAQAIASLNLEELEKTAVRASYA